VTHKGFEAIGQAEKLSLSIILMDIQMSAMPGNRKCCLATCANEYLSKPVSLRALLKIVEDFMKQK